MEKPNRVFLFRFVTFLSGILFALGTPSSQAETSGNGIQGAQLLYSLVASSRQAAANPEHSGDARDHPNTVFEASTIGYPSKIQSKPFSRPILFEANHGQTHPEVAFLAKLPGTNVFFTPTEIVLAVTSYLGLVHEGPSEPQTAYFRFRFEGASPEVRIEAHDQATARSHYLAGQSPGKWKTDIPVFTKIVYRNLYPGIDLCLYGNEGKLEYDFVVSPGANPDRIRIKALGGDKSDIDSQGNLFITTTDGASLKQMKPLAYQGTGAEHMVVSSQFEPMGDHRFGFRIGSYDGASPLVIDPVLDFSTYVGGARFDRGRDIAVDRQGNIYVTGQTQSTDFPLENPIDTQAGGSFDIFVLKFNPSGSDLIYSTYIAGSSLDIAYGIAVDGAGSAYLTGETSSGDFPSTIVVGGATSGVRAFVLKLSPDGATIQYATHFGGIGIEKGYDIAVDQLGNAFVTGLTSSTDFPTQNAVQSSRGGGFDAFVAKFSPSGAVMYSTYLGGSADDNLGASSLGGIAIAIDDGGNAYVTGDTQSTDFPTVNALYPSLSGKQDAFVAKLGPTGRPLIYSTYLGGSDVGNVFGEEGFGIGVDKAGNLYVAGITRSTDFPLQNPIQASLGGGTGDSDVFLSALNPQGSALIYSTYIGGKNGEGLTAGSLSVDRCGNVFVAATTNSSDFALENLSGTTISGTRVFLAKIEAGGTGLLYSANIGNGSSAKVALGPDTSAYLTGYTSSNTFPAVNAYQDARAGDADAYVSRISHVRPVGDLPGEYRVCGDEPVEIKVARDPSADPGREWFAFLLVSGGVPSPIFFLTSTGLETYAGDALNSYTPYPYTGNTILPAVTFDALGMNSGDQIIYAYLYEKDGVLNLNHIVFVTAR
jgi:hypothetical protein